MNRPPPPRTPLPYTTLFRSDVVVPDTGSLRDDLRRWVEIVATDLADPDVIALMRANIGAGPEGGHVCIADRETQLTAMLEDRKSTRLNSSHRTISYAVFCLK